MLIVYRKKYFSSEERLQIAQQSAAEKRQRKPSNKSESSEVQSPTLSEAPRRRRTFRKSDTKKQRRSSLPSAFNPTEVIGSNNAAWFESLPDKVKRSQFSKQEREAINQIAERPHTSSSLKPTLDAFTWDKNKAPPAPSAGSHSPSVSIAVSTRSHDTSKSEPAMKLSTRHKPSSEERRFPPSPQIPPVKIPSARSTPDQERLSNRRAFLLHPIPLPPPTLSPLPSLPSPDTSELLAKQLGHQPTISIDGAIHLDNTKTNPPKTAPEWYDEKLDFGFQSIGYRKPSISTYASSGPPRTMSPSISDVASLDTSGPKTPITPILPADHFSRHKLDERSHLQQIVEINANATNYSHRQKVSPAPSPKPAQKPVHLIDGFYADHTSMQPYSITIHYGNNDPLALQTLPVCDDNTGAKGAFAISDEQPNRGLRKVLKVIRGH